MSTAGSTSVRRSTALDDLRAAMIELFGAERRLRGRDQQRPGGLTSSQLRALSALAQEERVSAGRLAKSADLNPASVSAMLDQLEANGIIERQKDADDRRVCMVSLTQRGRSLLDERREHFHARWEQHFGDRSEEELTAALAVIKEMAQMLEGL
jgi:DNA-binding MarR family transcriptional regulator